MNNNFSPDQAGLNVLLDAALYQERLDNLVVSGPHHGITNNEPMWECCACNMIHNMVLYDVACPSCGQEKCGLCIDGTAADIVQKSVASKQELNWRFMSTDEILTPRALDREELQNLNQLKIVERSSPVLKNEELFGWDMCGINDLTGVMGRLSLLPPEPSLPPEVPRGGIMLPKSANGVLTEDDAIQEMRGVLVERDKGLRQNFYPQLPNFEGDYGFKPEELINQGVLFKQDIKPNNLTCEIHPFFAHDHWSNCPRDVWEFLAPALRLATMYLTKPVAMSYWVTVMKGERKFDVPMSLDCSTGFIPKQRIREKVKVTPEHVEDINLYFYELGAHTNNITFNFGSPSLDREVGTLWGMCEQNYRIELLKSGWYLTDDDRWVRPERKLPNMTGHRKTRITIFRDFYTTAVKLMNIKFNDENQKLRFFWYFASNLMHEMSHAIGYIDQFHGGDEAAFFTEPYMLDWAETESGRAWERWMFGGVVQPINLSADAQYGLAVFDWPENMRQTPSGGPLNIYWAVPMSYIENMQQQSTWDKDYNMDDPEVEKTFWVPREGSPQSLQLMCVTTRSRADYLQSKWEEQEAIYRARIKQLVEEMLANGHGIDALALAAFLNQKNTENENKPQVPLIRREIKAEDYPGLSPMALAVAQKAMRDRNMKRTKMLLLKEKREQEARRKHEGEKTWYRSSADLADPESSQRAFLRRLVEIAEAQRMELAAKREAEEQERKLDDEEEDQLDALVLEEMFEVSTKRQRETFERTVRDMKRDAERSRSPRSRSRRNSISVRERSPVFRRRCLSRDVVDRHLQR